jgi:hypothetical protein
MLCIPPKFGAGTEAAGSAPCHHMLEWLAQELVRCSFFLCFRGRMLFEGGEMADDEAFSYPCLNDQ